ncbi:MATE family efflux transporter [Terrisporobacter mayombei]|nr:MATE family efflux transporter [Terrisporobacter mayombei]
MEGCQDRRNYLFSDKSLYRLILPLIIEQLLLVTVGLVDSMMVSSLGEAAVSAVSLVDSINILLINTFTALATGGAVVAGQYIGQKREDSACKAADQLVLFLTVSSIVVMILCYLSKYFILHVVFGKIEADVMSYANTYIMIIFTSIPFIAIYNGGAALFRAMGNSKITMKISIMMNLVNLTGNAILIYGFKMGVAGSAIATVFSRMLAALVICYLIKNQDLQIHLSKKLCKKFDKKLIQKILYIGIPNGLENGMFQLGKIIVLNLIATFGTAAIAANAVGNFIALFQVVPGMAISQAALAVTSQCIGAGDFDQTKYYTKKLIKLSIMSILIAVLITTIALPIIIKAYSLSPYTAKMTKVIILYHGVIAVFIWTISFVLPNTLRASNDVKFCMIIAILSMWIFRIGFSYVLGRYMGLGVMGVWIAMSIDWIFRAICFVVRYKGGKWKTYNL